MISTSSRLDRDNGGGVYIDLLDKNGDDIPLAFVSDYLGVSGENSIKLRAYEDPYNNDDAAMACEWSKELVESGEKHNGKKKMYIVWKHGPYDDGDPGEHMCFSTREAAEKKFKEILDKCAEEGWRDGDGNTYEECLKKAYFQTTLRADRVFTACINEETIDEGEWFDD